MKRDTSFGANFCRRTLMTSAMAGAFTVAAHPAAAERCPPIPPARVKGPLVWMNMDQQDVDEAYDNDVYAFNSKNVLERQAANNEIARGRRKANAGAVRANRDRTCRYLQDEARHCASHDLHPWRQLRSGRSADAVYAEPFVKAGANFVAIDFTNVRETNGDIFPMVDQCRRAVSWTYRNAASFGGNADQIYLCSRSSGSHLRLCSHHGMERAGSAS